MSFVRTQTAAEVLSAVVVAGNLVGVVVLVSALVAEGDELGAGQLLLTTAAIWITNIAVFAVVLGAGRRRAVRARQARPQDAGLQVSQDADPEISREGWMPRVWDYLYVSVTNSSAFSPTDEMPLTVHAKLLMGTQSVISLARRARHRAGRQRARPEVRGARPAAQGRRRRVSVPSVPEPISLQELQLAARNHGMPLEALRFDLTPVGLHHLLIHYDIPVDQNLAARGRRPRRATAVALALDDLRARPGSTRSWRSSARATAVRSSIRTS